MEPLLLHIIFFSLLSSHRTVGIKVGNKQMANYKHTRVPFQFCCIFFFHSFSLLNYATMFPFAKPLV